VAGHPPAEALNYLDETFAVWGLWFVVWGLGCGVIGIKLLVLGDFDASFGVLGDVDATIEVWGCNRFAPLLLSHSGSSSLHSPRLSRRAALSCDAAAPVMHMDTTVMRTTWLSWQRVGGLVFEAQPRVE